MKVIRNQSFWELCRFFIVGSIAVGIDFIVYFGLLYTTPLSTTILKAISFVCGAIFSFIGHRKFVFHADNNALQKQVLPFILLYASALVVNNATNELVLKLIDIKIVGWFISTCVSTIWNFIGMKFGVFKKKPTSKED